VAGFRPEHYHTSHQKHTAEVFSAQPKRTRSRRHAVRGTGARITEEKLQYISLSDYVCNRRVTQGTLSSIHPIQYAYSVKKVAGIAPKLANSVTVRLPIPGISYHTKSSV
jgi:hypothetical protein